MDQEPAGLGRALVEDASRQVAAHIARIAHCLGQLDDKQVWWRPAEGMNSIANLVLHLCGNLDQRIGSVIGGGPDHRDRDREFSERAPITVGELIARIEAAGERARVVLDAFEPGRLLERRAWPMLAGTSEVSALSGLSMTLLHLAGHAQEILASTRMQLGDRYRYSNPAADPKAKTP